MRGRKRKLLEHAAVPLVIDEVLPADKAPTVWTTIWNTLTRNIVVDVDQG